MKIAKKRSFRSGELKRFLYSSLLVLLALLITSGTSISAWALSKQQLKIYATNGITLYNPEDNCTPSTSTRPTGDQITWIGDSYTAGSSQIIKKKFPGVDIWDLAQSPGRHFAWNGENRLNESGLSLLRTAQEDGQEIRKYVVFALGTNDQGSPFSDEIPAAIDEIESIIGNDRTLVLVTPRIENSTYETVIGYMESAASKYSNIRIADWASVIEDKQRSTLFTSDHIHPNEDGYQLWVDTIYSALPGGVGLVEETDNASIIWNYFASAGIEGISDNAAAIAGIMGNFKQEKNDLDPFYNRGFWGELSSLISSLLSGVGLGQYVHSNGGGPAPQVSMADVKKAITVELDYLTQNKICWLSTDWCEPTGFLKNLDLVADDPTPESYAELYNVAFERNFVDYAARSTIKNQKVLQLGRSLGHEYWGESETRREFAREFYERFSGAASTGTTSTKAISATTSSSSSGTGVEWEDGWLVTSTMPGSTIESAKTSGRLNGQPWSAYSQENDGKADKILLHSTEGKQLGMNAYSDGNVYPAHFTIDLKKKQVSQQFPITSPSMATKTLNAYGTIQIEIVGFSKTYHTATLTVTEDDPYYLQNFEAEDWDYLAVLLAAIAEQTGIELNSTLDWSTQGRDRLSLQEGISYTGILGHLHSPSPDDHTDPGDIWKYVEEAIARNPSAARFATGGSITSCSNGSSGSGALKEGGMSVEEAEEFMDVYREVAKKYSPRTVATNLDTPFGSESVYLYHSSCEFGPLNNCATFSQYFINRYTTLHTESHPGKAFVSKLLADNPNDLTDGGNVPAVYAIFSIPGTGWGHTGVVLGINGDTIITGEAHCSSPNIEVNQYSKSSVSNWRFAYTDKVLKGGL